MQMRRLPAVIVAVVMGGTGLTACAGLGGNSPSAASQTGGTQQVGAVAVAYNASGASKNVGAVVLTGPGTSSCGTITFLFYTAHLKVHSFIGNQGKVVKTGPILTLY
jgi:hypothetical protein